MGNTKKWRFAVDRGGTFTDVVGIDPDGKFHSLKLLSRSVAYSDASIEGVRRILNTPPGHPLPEDQIEGIRFGTTVATNALLERKGCRVALLITKGFADLLEIGYQSRPDIFSLCIHKPSLLYSEVLEIDERLDHRGKEITPLDHDKLSTAIDRLKKSNVQAVAVVLLHSWINPDHERNVEKELKKCGIHNIFLSHTSMNLIKVVSRGQSTLIDAYLSTVMKEYMNGIKNVTGSIPIEFMQSSGMLTDAAAFTGKNALLSGPAGGVISVSHLAKNRNLSGVIGFDMGGTSTDVCRFEGNLEKIYEQSVAGIHLQTEMLDIVTVAAGGGSILHFDGQRMTAGPESAGALPGPACYGLGGPLAVTDANLLTGRIIPSFFPESFGENRDAPLDVQSAEEKFAELRNTINASLGTGYSSQEVAAGFLRVANEKMAMAIREISVSRGFDVREYGLVCFGGAGGQHACSIASILDMDTILIHPLSSVMSAYGIGLSRHAWKSARTVLQPYNTSSHDKLLSLAHDIEADLVAENSLDNTDIVAHHEIDLRPTGTDSYLTTRFSDFSETIQDFTARYRRLFGIDPDVAELEAVNIRVELHGSQEYMGLFSSTHISASDQFLPDAYHNIYYADGPVQAPVFMTASLDHSHIVQGPAYIIDRDFTVIVDPEFYATTDERGVITLKRINVIKQGAEKQSVTPDPVLLEVFNNLFMGIATEMGLTLQKTACSVNIKERLDFSCALFDAQGELIANAPHIPVHLGSMGEAVKSVIKARGDTMNKGDMYLTNSPYHGGSHLPDLTVISPVFAEGGEILFFVAARGHHADIGGTTPGSMPPVSAHIDEEGILIHNHILVERDTFREDSLKELLGTNTLPARNINERLHDFRAQIAACRKGMSELATLVRRYGIATVSEYMSHIQNNAEYSVKKALMNFVQEDKEFNSSYKDSLDDGTIIKVSVRVTAGSNPPHSVKAVIDFTGTGMQHDNDNLNAPEAVTRSAVLYVLRSLLDEEIPLNSGCLKPVDIIIPSGSILSPVYPAPVASGNVETSQRIVDVLLGAFGVAAASQGTMNNLLFQSEGESTYYETIAGGAGASKTCHGASAVQVHMTNTRITDPEILEVRHPSVRLEQFLIRKGSGGKGKFCGGEGVIRELKFLKPSTVSLITERRNTQPYGLEGGEPGQPGNNYLKNKNGQITTLHHREVLKTEKDESIIIETPGGGGYGRSEKLKNSNEKIQT